MNKNKNLVEEEKIYDSVHSILFGAFYDIPHERLHRITRDITKVALKAHKRSNSSESAQKPKLVFPWAATDGYFNGDMFEDWLNSKLDPDDPYFKLQRMIKAREIAIYSQFVDEAIKILKKSVLDRGRV